MDQSLLATAVLADNILVVPRRQMTLPRGRVCIHALAWDLTPEHGFLHAMFVERDDNFGVSVTNCAEHLVKAIRNSTSLLVGELRGIPVVCYEAYQYRMRPAEMKVDPACARMLIRPEGGEVYWAPLLHSDKPAVERLSRALWARGDL